MKNRGVILILCSILILIVFSNITSADVGRHPHLILEITENGQPINDTVLVCTDEWHFEGVEWPYYIPYWDEQKNYTAKEDRNYAYVKEGVDSKEFQSCFYCNDEGQRYRKEKCRLWFYNLPTKIAILYPAYDDYYYFYYNTSVKKSPVLYRGDLNLPALVMSPVVEVNLKPNGEMVLNNNINLTKEDKFNFFLGLGLTILIELIFTFIYLLRKKGNVSKNLLLVVLFANIVSFTIFWLILPYIITNAILYLILGEIFVFLLEALMIRYFKKKEMSIKNSIILSFFMNLVSFLIGGFIFMFITMWFGTL